MLTLLNASEVQITANKFMADETKGISVFTGSVHVVRGADDLKADKVVINFDKNKQPIKYTATGHAEVKMNINKKRYLGKGGILIYEPKLLTYIIKNNAFLHEIDTDKKVYGDTILVNQAKGYYEVDSQKNKPVKFIFQIKDKKN